MRQIAKYRCLSLFFVVGNMERKQINPHIIIPHNDIKVNVVWYIKLQYESSEMYGTNHKRRS